MPSPLGRRPWRWVASRGAKWRGIIGRRLRPAMAALGTVALLAGCSTARLGYDNGVMLAHWWLDSRLDFSAEQSERVKAALTQWQAWHRATQLDIYANWLAEVRAEGAGSVTPAQMCRWSQRLRALAEPTVAPLLPALAELAPTLKPAQIDRLQRRLAEDEERLKRDVASASAQERLDGAVKRSVERFEGFYGRLSAEQRSLVADATRRSPFQPERWLAERQWRHREMLQALRRAASAPGTAPSASEWQSLVGRLASPPQPDGGAYKQQLSQHLCELAARVHNSASAEQRQAALRKLRGWEQDARELARAAVLGAQAAR